MSTPAEQSSTLSGDAYLARTVEILNEACGSQELWGHHDIAVYRVVYAAASRIDSLQAQVEVLREALEPFAALANEMNQDLRDDFKLAISWAAPTAGQLRKARAALTQSSDAEMGEKT